MSQIASQTSNSKTDRLSPVSGPDQANQNGSNGAVSRSSEKLALLYAPVAPVLADVETMLHDNLRSETPWVDQLLEHSWLLSGKRMRPVLLLLSGLAFNQQSKSNATADDLPASLVPMATAVEMIHTATLVHDDVIDDADVRRHQPTANSKWDNRISVLLGDYLFTHAFHVGSKADSVKALAMLAAASNKVCAGEMKQNFHAGKFDITAETYFEIISEKTAELCAVSCAAGALLAGADEGAIEQYEQYGRDLGMAFQIIDDVLDLDGDADTVGKTLGTDLVNRKPTLPVIHCLSKLDEDRRRELLTAIADPQQLDQVIATLASTGSIEYARSVARSYIESAASFAGSLGNGTAAQSLQMIAKFVLKRAH